MARARARGAGVRGDLTQVDRHRRGRIDLKLDRQHVADEYREPVRCDAYSPEITRNFDRRKGRLRPEDLRCSPFSAWPKQMSNVASVLKEEISRISRREIRRETSSLKKSSTTYRSDIAALKRRVLELERQLRRVGGA